MLEVKLIAASLAAAGPATAPPAQPLQPVIEAPAIEAAPAEVPPGAAPPASAPASESESPTIELPAEADAASPAAEQQAASADDFDLDLEQTGLEHDPLEGFNRLSFEISQVLDKIVIRPVAMVYRHVVPKPGRDGVHNVLSNIGEPLVFLNDILQLRPDRAIRTLGRFLLNSTLGIGGLFDVAKRKPFHLPHHANGFGDTLGYYGVGPGPYIYVPVLGPTTLRDMIGSADQLLPPMAIGNPLDRTDYQVTTNVLDGLDQRERSDDDLKVMLSDAIDPYATFRANYLQNRAGEIAKLKARGAGHAAPLDPLADPLVDPAAPKDEPAPAGQ